jgi:hypothetical protein
MNKAALKKSVRHANSNIEKRGKFTVAELKQINDHVTNADFIERTWLHKEVPALTKEQMDALVANKLRFEMDLTRCSKLLWEVLGGFEGTGIDEVSYVVAIWGQEELDRNFSS